ncbi:MAG: uroporphyrinogen-III synthase [Acidobacteriota bacterium]
MTRPRVLIVRSGANPFASVGDSAAVDVVEKVSHSIEAVAPPERAEPGSADLAVFTSQVAVERVAADPRLAWLLQATRRASRVAAVGPATAEALRARGIRPHVVGTGSSERLLEQLPTRLDGWRVILPCGEDAPRDLAEGLRLRGAHVDRFDVYRKVARARDAGLESEILERPFSAFCATSPSAAEWLFEGLAESAAERLRSTPAVVLGRFTRRFLEARGVGRIFVTPDARFASALSLLEELATASGGA